MKFKSYATGLILMGLVAGFVPVPAHAGGSGSDGERPVRLYASARFGPIGVINSHSFALHDVLIDERFAQGEASIWGGELIRVIGSGKVRAAFESLGEVTLGRGAVVRFTTARAANNESSSEVLVIALEQGGLDVRLNSAAGAYIEAAGSVITAEPGASFGIDVKDARASVVKLAGAVSIQDQPFPQDVKIRLVDDLGRPLSAGTQLSVRARSTRQVQVQVTDKNDKPLPDLAVLFSLGDPCLGSLGLGVAAGGTFRQKTDKRGIAAVPLVAGAAKCAASILVRVEGANASVSIPTSVLQPKSFFNARNTSLLGVGLGTVFLTRILIVKSGSDDPSIRPVSGGVRP